ncbi:MAG TPA: hypothetical protein PLE54_12310 [Burkholderiaceae bacterium]|nr:hypothetical protein [Burkholderiaceae bacterium]HQR71382.1 hypothetical protein [Burkholderiaceae bacterium]
MRTDRPRTSLTCHLARGLLAAALLAAAITAHATDIAWRQVTTKKAELNEKFARQGTATLRGGEEATVQTEGTLGAKDAKGLQTYKAKSVLRFKDKSTITIQYSGAFDVATYANRGSGQIVDGTGRFAGIKGKVTFDGRVRESDWTGSYTQSAK